MEVITIKALRFSDKEADSLKEDVAEIIKILTSITKKTKKIKRGKK